MAALPGDHANELRNEKALLVKAEVDIEEGWKRLRNQQDLVLELQAAGHDIAQAERLVRLMQNTLVEWERHRTLIEQRITYLEGQVLP